MTHFNISVAGLAALALPVALSACAASGAEAADFPAPDDAQARVAYLAAYQADLLGPDSQAYLKDVPERLRSTHLGMADPGQREVAERILRTTSGVKIAGCQWAAFDESVVQDESRPRAKDKLTAGYLCDLTVHLANPQRGPLAAPARGYFYKDGGTLAFAGEYAPGWQPDRAANRQVSTHTGGSWGGDEPPP